MPLIVQLSFFDSKQCRICGLVKDLNEFPICRGHRDGRGAYCKPCDKKKSKEYYLANKVEHRARAHAYYFANREQWREYAHQWYMKNHEKQATKGRKYRQENRDYFRDYFRTYYLENKDYLNAQNREAHARNKVERNEKHRHWRRANRAKCRELWHRRRTRLKAAVGRYTAAEWGAMLKWFGGACLCCGAYDDVTIDHVVPLVKGGANEIGNIQPLCRSCNSSKHTQSTDYRDPEHLAAFLASLRE